VAHVVGDRSVGRVVYPILFLHACLLPLNVIRLRQLRRLVQAVRTARDEDALQALVPYMKTESHASGAVLFRLGDPADKLYLLQRGRVFFPEIDKHVAGGAVFGEVGLLAAPGTRSLTAVCEGGCRLSTITKEKALELYYQDPRFGMFLIRLISGYALDDASRGPTSPTGGRPPGSRPDRSTGLSVSDIEGP
jgi:CRP/FNR family cyclic AMP-dependent transcriptional regulator